MSYFVNDTNLTSIFNSGSGGSATNYRINNTDLNNSFLPFGTNHKLRYPYNTGYQITGNDIRNRFQLNIISSSTATFNYENCNDDFAVIRITGSGSITFRYDIIGATFVLVAGGGAGGSTLNSGNAGGGGGAGELCVHSFAQLANTPIVVGIGAGGVNTNARGGNGGNSNISFSSGSVVVQGGGGGGAGKQTGSVGGSGGGGGSYSESSTAGGISVKSGIIGSSFGNNGGAGEDQNNDSGQGGGGGGATSAGVIGGGSTANGAGGSGYTFTQGGFSVTLAGGGGGGANQYQVYGRGGSGIGGNGGYGATAPGAGAPNTGSGGGGGPNDQGNNLSWGNVGGSGVCYLCIPHSSISIIGLRFNMYSGYFSDNVDWFNTAGLLTINGITSGFTQNINSISGGTNGLIVSNVRDNYSVQWIGNFYADITGIWTFFTNSDDASYLWIGNNALSGYTTANALVNNGGLHGITEKSGTISLTAGTSYPIRIQFGDSISVDNMIVSFTPPSGSKTTDGLNRYYPPRPEQIFITEPQYIGLRFTMYSGYFNANVNWFNTASLLTINGISSGFTYVINSISGGTNGLIVSNVRDNYSVQWIGNFYADITGIWTFFTNSDDASYLWIGNNALSGYTTANALVNNISLQEKSGTISLTAGTSYPIRIQFGDSISVDNMIVSFTPPSGSKTTDGLNRYYPPKSGQVFA